VTQRSEKSKVRRRFDHVVSLSFLPSLLLPSILLVNQSKFLPTIADTIGSVLPPPPPRYTIPVAYAAGAANGMAVPVVETNNTITHPERGCPLQVGEGMYI
jgi:hypothetical protein